jgi:hypothetical protein
MRSKPRAMLCDALVRRELGSDCVYLDVSMLRGLRVDRPRGQPNSAATFSSRPHGLDTSVPAPRP